MGGSLVDIGVMSAAALFLAIPSSFFWGYVCDKTKRYKRYVLTSFLSLTVLLYLFTLTTSIGLLIILYAAMSILHVAHEPPKNVLIAELISYGNETLLVQPKSLIVIFASLTRLFNGQVPEGDRDQTPVALHRFSVHPQNKNVHWVE